MKLRNYSSSVSTQKSVSAIEDLLIKAKAIAVSKFYEDGHIAGFLFQIPVNGIAMTFKLPVNPLGVRRVMEAEVKKPRKGTMNRIWDQSERTAWKLLHDWVHTQLSMIQMEQAEAMQIFLPYVYDGKSDQTFFEKLKGNGFKQLTASTQPESDLKSGK